MKNSWLLALLLVALALPACRSKELVDGRFGAVTVNRSHRKLLQGVTVSVGYRSSATFKVPTGGDALKAFDAASARLKSAGGGTLRIEAGTYTFSNQWSLTSSNTAVVGAGMGKTILKLRANAGQFKLAGFIRFRGLKNVQYSDFTIDGNKGQQKKTSASAMLKSSITYGRYCFFCDGFTDLTMRRVRASNCQGYGFDPHGIKFNPTIFSKGVDIQDCESINNNWDGYAIDQILGGTIANNLAKGNGRHGFNIITGSKNIVVKNNRAENNGFGSGEKSGDGCSFTVQNAFKLGTSDIDIIGNTGIKANRGALCISDSPSIKATGNTFNGARVCLHVTAEGAKRITFSSNKCSGTTKGLFIGNGAKASEVTLSGNTGL